MNASRGSFIKTGEKKLSNHPLTIDIMCQVNKKVEKTTRYDVEKRREENRGRAVFRCILLWKCDLASPENYVDGMRLPLLTLHAIRAFFGLS